LEVTKMVIVSCDLNIVVYGCSYDQLPQISKEGDTGIRRKYRITVGGKNREKRLVGRREDAVFSGNDAPGERVRYRDYRNSAVARARDRGRVIVSDRIWG